MKEKRYGGGEGEKPGRDEKRIGRLGESESEPARSRPSVDFWLTEIDSSPEKCNIHTIILPAQGHIVREARSRPSALDCNFRGDIAQTAGVCRLS